MSNEQIMKEALEEIANPIGFMQRRLKEGENLDGGYAIMLANDANYLKNVAKKALEAIKGATEAGGCNLPPDEKLFELTEKIVFQQYAADPLGDVVAKMNLIKRFIQDECQIPNDNIPSPPNPQP